MSRLANKRILLGVTGGIAAYKAAELTRLLRKQGAQVRVAMTNAAADFVSPLTFQALSGQPVRLDLLDENEESSMGHIHLARWAELIVIAPATADFMARLRLGMADDLLSTLCLAAEAPMLLAPAMNRAMWSNPATMENVAVLRSRGMRFVGPEEGEQACGEIGVGRMREPLDILDRVGGFFSEGSLAGVKILITAGPTREPIDPVRYLTNRSSGKMGYALALAALDAGASVTLVSGPVAIDTPPGLAELAKVETAADMFQAVMERAEKHAIYIGAAAVADYTPAAFDARKIKKTEDAFTISLARTRDILATVAALPDRPYTVGFAAETEDLEANARLKLESKNLDMIAANRVGQSEGGFDSDANALSVYWPGGEKHLPMAAKSVIAAQLIELISEHYRAKNSTENPR